ncbi:MAG TPA: hypothetical protein VKH43_00970, partial [Thermoanaerobaculia bacterium]|nr:hypothetical protein [Thermoanaerobaculia bacterium]
MVTRFLSRKRTIVFLAGSVAFLAAGILALAQGGISFFRPLISPPAAEAAQAPAAQTVQQSKPSKPVAAPAAPKGRTPLVIDRLAALGNNFDQCANGSPATGTCSWVSGNLQSNNSSLFEGMATAQRLLITSGLVNGDNTLILGYSYTQSSKHSYDYYMSWEKASAEALLLTGHAYDFGNGAGVVNKPSCIDYNGGDVTSCAALTAANGGAGFFADASVPDDHFISTIFGNLSGKLVAPNA